MNNPELALNLDAASVDLYVLVYFISETIQRISNKFGIEGLRVC